LSRVQPESGKDLDILARRLDRNEHAGPMCILPSQPGHRQDVGAPADRVHIAGAIRKVEPREAGFRRVNDHRVGNVADQIPNLKKPSNRHARPVSKVVIMMATRAV